MADKKAKPQVKPDATTAASPNKPFDFAAAMKAFQASNSGNAATGAVYTQQDADAAVQSTYQQLFGKNAQGVDYKNASAAYLNQSQDTGESGRQQAVINYVQSTPEYKAKQEDKYLDAIYAEIDANVRKARG
jgi:hypothetical protein